MVCGLPGCVQPTRRTATASPRVPERESQSIKLPTLVNKLQSGTRPKRLYLQGLPLLPGKRIITLRALFSVFFGGVPTHFESAFLGLCICLPCCGCRVVGAIFYLFAKANLSQASKALKNKLLFRIEFQFVPRVFPHKNARIRNWDRDRWDIGNRIRNGVTQGAVSLYSSVSPSLLSSQIFYR